MQFKFIPSLLLLLAASVAAGPQDETKSFLISFPDGTPDSFVARSMDELKKLGIQITHEFDIFKGFAFKAKPTIVDQFEKLPFQANANQDWKPAIEEDGPVYIAKEGKKEGEKKDDERED